MECNSPVLDTGLGKKRHFFRTDRLRQMFCLHEWVGDGPITESVCFDSGVPESCLSQELVCEKCGKRKIERFK